MSTLSVATINSTSTTTDLTIRSANSSTQALVLASNGDIYVGNSTVKPFQVAANNLVGIASANVTTNTFNMGSSSVGAVNFANGYSRLPNGLLMQWGSQAASVNTITSATATFATAFTNVFSVTVSGPTTGSLGVLLTTANNTAITWRSTSTVAAASVTVYYMAIGK